MNLLLKRAEMYDQLVKLNTQYPGDKMTPSIAREFSKMCDSLDEISARISFQELEEKVLNSNENLTPTNFYGNSKNEFRTSAAKRTLADAFGMLARGERKKITHHFLTNWAKKTD
jgi:hypothetical protein